MAWQSPKKKKRTRYFNSHMKKLQAVNEKYTVKFQNIGIGSFLNHTTIYGDSTGGAFLSYLEMQKPAWEYADDKAERSLTWYQKLVSGSGGSIFASFILAVGVVVLNFVTAGASTPLTIAVFAAGLAGATAGYVAASAAAYFEGKAQAIGGQIQSKAGAVSAYENKAQKEKESNNLTALMIYSAYEIYANGGIFKQGSPGSETFSNNITYDTSKGLRGDLKKDDLDEKIHGRVGADAAGGINFHSKNLGVEFPLANFNLTAEEFNDQLINKYRLTLNILADAFVELNNLEFNHNGRAGEVYNLKAEKYTRATKNSIYQNDFLDKLKNYNKNLRADFNFADDKMFAEKKKSTKDIKGALGAIENLEEFYNDESLSKDFKAEYYIDAIIMLLDLLEDFCEFKYFTSRYRFYYYHDGGVTQNHNDTVDFLNFKTQSYQYNIGNRYKGMSSSGMPEFTTLYANSVAFANSHGGENYFCGTQTINHFPNYADEDRIFYDFSDLNILQKYYHKTTNKTYNGNEIIAIYDELLKSLYQGGGLYGCLFFETRAYTYNNGRYAYSPYMFLSLGKEAFDIFNSALKIPTQLSFYDFSKIERSRDNTQDD